MTAKLSRERLEEIAALPLKKTSWGLEHAPGAYSTVRSHEIVEMARMLLAGMDSDPVAYLYSASFERGHVEGELTDAPGCDMPVYSAPTALAIPDHMKLIDKGWLMMLEDSHQTLLDYRADSVWYWQGDEDDQPEILSCPVIMSAETLRELLAKSAPPAPVALPDELTREEYKRRFMEEDNFDDTYRGGWEACRAAMLKAGPVTGWIKCSERMPEQKQSNRYIGLNLLLNERTVVQGGFDDGSFWLDGVRIDNVTRWMPLPAAPEQEV